VSNKQPKKRHRRVSKRRELKLSTCAVKRRGVRAAVAVSKNLAPGNGFSASTSDVALLLSVSSANLCNAARGAGTTTRFQHRESKDCDDCRSSCDLVIILFLEEEEDRLVLLIAAPRRNRLPHPNPNAAAAILFPLQNARYIYIYIYFGNSVHQNF
jgi:hypothetical protein